jgi:hypothetical protein
MSRAIVEPERLHGQIRREENSCEAPCVNRKHSENRAFMRTAKNGTAALGMWIERQIGIGCLKSASQDDVFVSMLDGCNRKNGSRRGVISPTTVYEGAGIR